MTEKKSTAEKDRAKAAKYYALALQHEKQLGYKKALLYFQKSLQLHDDKVVKKAYLKLLSIIGPM